MEILLIIGAIIVISAIFSNNKSSSKITYTDETGTQKTESLQRRKSRHVANIEQPANFEMSIENKRVLDLMAGKQQNIFLTGKAGTGKSTLLRYFRSTTTKNHAVVAPTGIAAINVQGQTIHSFFGFKVGVTLGTVRYASYEKLKVLRNIETLIIDEISMVRADLLDCMDKSLRMNRRNNLPFGGVQIIAIGDPYQLPPVVTASEEKFIMRTYGAPHFFKANSYKSGNFKTVELNKIYRQSDPEFIGILNAVRTGEHKAEHINQLHALTTQNRPTGKSIHLVTTNQMAQSINRTQLGLLSTNPVTYTAQSEGNFSERVAPTDIELTLKEGAKVMLLNNDRDGRWVNGDVGTIIGLDKSAARVKFDDDGSFEDVGPNIWENIQFQYDEETHKIEPVVVGRFVQLPIKLAWAVTIHKSQGKTYDNVHIDFGSGTFAPGQAYVALSRATSPAGLSFEAPMMLDDVLIDKHVKEFMQGKTRKLPVASQQASSPNKPVTSTRRAKAPHNVTKSSLSQLKFFVQNPEKYASGTQKSRKKVAAAKKTFELIRNQLSDKDIAVYDTAMKKYSAKVRHK
jgi:ATP-dependent exoDNAse (exonuclease V) alpha subunit